MDPLAGLLAGPRARGAFVLRSDLSPPWALEVADGAPLTVVALVTGAAWLLPQHAPPQQLGPGDVAVVRGPAPYVMADAPGTPPQAVIGPGQTCTTPDGAEVSLSWRGARVWGSPDVAAGATRMVTGTYTDHAAVSSRLLEALPPAVVVPATGTTGPVATWLASEVASEAPGQEAVLDRLLDLLLVTALRAWFDRPDVTAPGWYAAAADPLVGPALRLLQDQPARRWTVAALAAATTTSRATLARRFTALVGQPPMTYLTAWRLDLAADLLLEPAATLASVARRVGYSTPYALSAAFTRHHGLTPTAHRHRRLGPPAQATAPGALAASWSPIVGGHLERRRQQQRASVEAPAGSR
ncbi:AraC family transcriptional regulator [uncultured Pseudokineococcus sp.]|uniref:AraC family transcriptional regulator n=1 Tax=uncultured Pseudokineococcus sp. TaxID=1642928 RepID=UPI0026212688|nr:AraC family transcriptional regulator [uncultured Pseudokineococcus sp.]